jgi:hypothetical protein
MRVRRHTAALMITSAIFAAGVVAPADAEPGNGNANGHQKLHCRAFHATGVGVDKMGKTTADIFRGKRQIATSYGDFDVTGVDAAGVASFTGTIDLVFEAGALKAPVVGTLDTASGEFTSTSDTVTGTGDRADVTGRLTFSGVEDLDGLTFTETVHGKLCVPKKKQH